MGKTSINSGKILHLFDFRGFYTHSKTVKPTMANHKLCIGDYYGENCATVTRDNYGGNYGTVDGDNYGENYGRVKGDNYGENYGRVDGKVYNENGRKSGKSDASRESPTCSICFVAMVDRVVLIPCGHADFCQNCIVQNETRRPNEKKCPLCMT